MKYVVGDLILIKDINLRSRQRPVRLRPRLRLRLHRRRLRQRLLLRPHINNTYGIITEIINHNDAWEGESKECDNAYVWLSQIDGKEYWFCEDEVIGEIVK